MAEESEAMRDYRRHLKRYDSALANVGKSIRRQSGLLKKYEAELAAAHRLILAELMRAEREYKRKGT